MISMTLQQLADRLRSEADAHPVDCSLMQTLESAIQVNLDHCVKSTEITIDGHRVNIIFSKEVLPGRGYGYHLSITPYDLPPPVVEIIWKALLPESVPLSSLAPPTTPGKELLKNQFLQLFFD